MTDPTHQHMRRTDRRHGQRIHSRRNRWVLAVALSLIVVVGWRTAFARQLSPEAADREAKIKAAYLYQIINYVDWPTTAFSAENSPFVIGVVGDSPIIGYLETIAKSKAVKGRTLQVMKLTGADMTAQCHLLFITSSADDTIESQAFKNYTSKPSLIVGEQDDAVPKGGVMNLAVENNQVRLRLSLAAAKRQQLKISSKLSVIAKLVD